MNTIVRNATGLSRLVWTAGIVLGSCLPHWFSLPVWIRGLLLIAVGWRFAARILRWPLPGRKSMWLVTIACFAGVLFEFNTINGLGPGTALLVVMVSLKFLEARSQRDYALLTVIAYFLVFASLLVGGGVIKGLYLVGFVWITTLGLLKVGRQGSLLPNVPTGKLAGRLLLQALPLMLILFILFPRWTGPLWALPGDTSSGATGLSGSMSPGDITDLALSDEIAFRVEFDGQTPAASELYWRGPVLSKFDGRTWDQFDGMRAAGQRTIEYNGETSNYVVKLDSIQNGWLFALEMPQTWDNLTGRLDIRMDSDFQLRIGGFGGGAGRIDYSVTSHSNFRAMETISVDALDSFRNLPAESNPRTRALVDSFLADSPDTDTIVARALDVFRQDGFFYTLTPPPLGEHTADEFIFDTQEGFCEHYASAFAIMMRMAGVPTRVVTGYQGGELNSMGDYYIIRQSDAHAWTEIWSADRGWYRVDPIQAVAPERIAFGSQRMSFQGERTIASQIARMRWLRRAALAWDAANNFWDDWVIGYGPRLQRTLLERLGFDRPRWRELLIMTVSAATLLTLALAGYLSLRARRLNGRDPAARSFEKFTRRLRQLSVEPIRDGETPTAYGWRAAAALPERAKPIREITECYLQARYEPDRQGAALAGLKARVNAFSRGYARASR
jgi:transglutaminase-like putative cysteine protease